MRTRKEYNYEKLKTDELSELLCHMHFYLKRYGTYQLDYQQTFEYITTDFLLAYLLDGSCEVTIGQNVYSCQKGSYLLLTPYQYFRIKNLQKQEIGKFYYFHFSIDDNMSAHRFTSLFTRYTPVIDEAEVKDQTLLFEMILQEEKAKDYGYKSVVQAALRKLVGEMLRSQIRRAIKKDEYVSEIYQPYLKIVYGGIEYIQQHYQDSIRLGDIANHLNVSTSVLYKAFMQILNSPPATFIQEQKIFICEKMLEEGKRVGLIYQLLGYSSAYHLSKSFKQHVGISPREYKKCLKAQAKYR